MYEAAATSPTPPSEAFPPHQSPRLPSCHRDRSGVHLAACRREERAETTRLHRPETADGETLNVAIISSPRGGGGTSPLLVETDGEREAGLGGKRRLGRGGKQILDRVPRDGGELVGPAGHATAVLASADPPPHGLHPSPSISIFMGLPGAFARWLSH